MAYEYIPDPLERVSQPKFDHFGCEPEKATVVVVGNSDICEMAQLIMDLHPEQHILITSDRKYALDTTPEILIVGTENNLADRDLVFALRARSGTLQRTLRAVGLLQDVVLPENPFDQTFDNPLFEDLLAVVESQTGDYATNSVFVVGV